MKQIFTLLTVIYLFTTNILAYENTYYLHKVSQFELLTSSKDAKIMMLGDSITERGLWSELTSSSNIINRGISGDTTLGVLNRLDMLNPNLEKAYVMIGVNDLFKGRSVNYIFKNYIKIIAILKKKNIEPIIESCLFVGSNLPNSYNIKIKKLNLLLLKYAKKNKISFIDLNTKLSPEGYLSYKYSLDGVHLNANGYALWLKELKLGK